MNRRVRVRRERRGRIVLALFMLLAGLYLFIFWARPRVAARGTLDLSETPAPEARVTEEVDFQALCLTALVCASAPDELGARVEAARYAARGGAGYVYAAEGKYLSLMAGFDAAAEAEAVAKRLSEEEKIDCTLLKLSSPGARLRVTATPTQLKALTGAEKALRDCWGALGSAAEAQGAQELSEARLTLKAQSEALARARAELSRAAGPAPNRVAEELLEMLDDASRLQGALSADSFETPLSFSAKIRYNWLDGKLRHIAFLNALSA